MSAPAGRGARLPAGAPDDDPHRRPRRLLRAARLARARSPSLLAWAERRGRRGRSGRLRLEPPGSGCRVPRTCLEAGRLARNDRAGRRAPALRRRRAPAAGRGAAPRRAGLSGLEFGVNIPGTVGGAVKMNANAYGGDLVARARVGRGRDARRAPSGARPDELGFSYRRSNLGRERDRGARVVRARAGGARGGQGHARRHARRAQGGAAVRHQDLRLDLQEPRRPARGGPQRGRAARRGRLPRPQVGGARFSEKHANFVENMGEATTADVIALMAEGRRRVRERFGVELEPEVQLLGDVDAAPLWGRHERRARRRRPSRPRAGRARALGGAQPLRCESSRRASSPRLRRPSSCWPRASCSPPATSSGCATRRWWRSSR